MIHNRSVPADTVLPHLVYRDVASALVWLHDTFGFIENFRYGDPASPDGAQMRFGAVCIMLSKARPGRSTPAETGVWTQSVTVFVEELERHFAQTRSTGARIIEEFHETAYGELQYGVEDLDGHPWIFARHARDLDPSEWGAITAPDS